MASVEEAKAALLEFLKNGGVAVEDKSAEEAKKEMDEATKEYEEKEFTIPKKPSEGTFYIADEVWQGLCYAVQHNKKVLLLGPTGCGKTETAFHVAKAFKRKCHTFNLGSTQDARVSLLGRTTSKPGQGVVFRPALFLETLQEEGAVHVWDELSRASKDAMNIVLPLLDRQGQVIVDEQEDEESRIVKKAETLAILATANLGFDYVAAGRIDLALLNRFDFIVYLDFPPKEFEKKVLVSRTKISAKVADKLVDAANEQRNEWRSEEFSSAVSTRQLLAVADAIRHGVRHDVAITYALQSVFSNVGAGSEYEKIGQIFQRHLGKS